MPSKRKIVEDNKDQKLVKLLQKKDIICSDDDDDEKLEEFLKVLQEKDCGHFSSPQYFNIHNCLLMGHSESQIVCAFVEASKRNSNINNLLKKYWPHSSLDEGYEGIVSNIYEYITEDAIEIVDVFGHV